MDSKRDSSKRVVSQEKTPYAVTEITITEKVENGFKIVTKRRKETTVTEEIHKQQLAPIRTAPGCSTHKKSVFNPRRRLPAIPQTIPEIPQTVPEKAEDIVPESDGRMTRRERVKFVKVEDQIYIEPDIDSTREADDTKCIDGNLCNEKCDIM